MNEYYNPSIDELFSRQKQTDEKPKGCIWQFLILLLLFLLLLIVY